MTEAETTFVSVFQRVHTFWAALRKAVHDVLKVNLSSDHITHMLTSQNVRRRDSISL